MTLYWESIVFAAIAFLILYWLLNKYAFGPLFGVMEQRREQVLNEMQTAEQNRKDSEQYLAEQKEAIQQARQEALQIIEQARVTSTRQSDELLEQAQSETIRMKNEAMKDIENEKKKAVSELKSQVSAMSVLIASKIVEKQIDEKSQHEVVKEYLGKVGRS